MKAPTDLELILLRSTIASAVNMHLLKAAATFATLITLIVSGASAASVRAEVRQVDPAGGTQTFQRGIQWFRNLPQGISPTDA